MINTVIMVFFGVGLIVFGSLSQELVMTGFGAIVVLAGVMAGWEQHKDDRG